jgi:predicted NBD/HSP70 family sugar kinase
MPDQAPADRTRGDSWARTLRRVGWEVGLRTITDRATLSRTMALGNVSVAVRDAEAAGILAPPRRFAAPPLGPGRPGRPPEYLQLDASLCRMAAAHLHHDRVEVAVCDAQYTQLAFGTFDLPGKLVIERAYADTLELVARVVTELLSTVPVAKHTPLAVGLALPAPVAEGRTASRLIFGSWHGRSIPDTLRSRLKIKRDGFDLREAFDLREVSVGNDATLGALGMRTLRKLKNPNMPALPLAYVVAGEGIGLGLVNELDVVYGAAGLAGELGHLKISDGGPLCPRCGGAGCLETRAAIPAIVDRVRAADGTLDTIKKVLAGAHPASRRALRDAGAEVGRALAHMCVFVNPAEVVIGGELSASGEFLRAVELALDRDVLPDALPRVDPAPPDAAPAPELTGALTQALRSMLSPLLTQRAQTWVQDNRVSGPGAA